jgi:hypothetical protein
VVVFLTCISPNATGSATNTHINNDNNHINNNAAKEINENSGQVQWLFYDSTFKEQCKRTLETSSTTSLGDRFWSRVREEERIVLLLSFSLVYIASFPSKTANRRITSISGSLREKAISLLGWVKMKPPLLFMGISRVVRLQPPHFIGKARLSKRYSMAFIIAYFLLLGFYGWYKHFLHAFLSFVLSLPRTSKRQETVQHLSRKK